MASEVAHLKPLRVRRMRFFSVSFLFVAGIVNYLDRTSFSIANTSIRADLGLSGTRMGALLSAFSLAYGVAQLPIGLMLDRIGPRVILAVGMFVWSLAQMATGLVSSFGGFMATRISLGAGEAPMMPCGVKVMNDWFSARDRGLPTGLHDGFEHPGGNPVPADTDRDHALLWLAGHVRECRDSSGCFFPWLGIRSTAIGTRWR